MQLKLGIMVPFFYYIICLSILMLDKIVSYWFIIFTILWSFTGFSNRCERRCSIPMRRTFTVFGAFECKNHRRVANSVLLGNEYDVIISWKYILDDFAITCLVRIGTRTSLAATVL